MISEIDIKDWYRVNEPKLKHVKDSLKHKVFPYTNPYSSCYSELQEIHDSLLSLMRKSQGSVAALLQPPKKDS